MLGGVTTLNKSTSRAVSTVIATGAFIGAVGVLKGRELVKNMQRHFHVTERGGRGVEDDIRGRTDLTDSQNAYLASHVRSLKPLSEEERATRRAASKARAANVRLRESGRSAVRP